MRCRCGADEAQKLRWERARRLSDLAPSQWAQTFARFDGRHNANAAYATECWAANCSAVDTSAAARRWLVLWGRPGTGKSHLLAAAFNALVGRGQLPIYVVWPMLLDRIRDGIGDGDYSRRLDAACQAPILLIDDLCAEARSGWTDELTYKLIDYRYRQELPTAIATNVAPADLEPRVASRIGDLAVATTLHMAGPDYRISAARAEQSPEDTAEATHTTATAGAQDAQDTQDTQDAQDGGA